MRLTITHETRYQYSSDVEQAHHVAMLAPAALPKQQLLWHRLTIDPPPDAISETRDEDGFLRTYFEIAKPHRELRAVAESEVITTALPPSQQGKLDRVGLPLSEPWQRVAERLRYRAGEAFEPAQVYMQSSSLAPIDARFAAYATALASDGMPVYKLASELAQCIHREFVYSPNATDVDTSPLTALESKRGVCQDFAQVMIACFRSMGLAAKYVSGYLLTEPPRGQPRLIGADASHAWVAVYCPREGWLELDPTNNCLAGESHVVVAYGRDYSDVPPLRGVIRGGGAHELSVAVTVAPAAQRE